MDLLHDPSCPFCLIEEEKAPAYLIHNDARTISFLDIMPFAEGHTLVIPRNHVELFSELDHDTLASLFIAAAKVARLLKRRLGVEGINVLVNEGKVAGQVVPHVHIHLIPRKLGDEPIFSERVQAEKSTLELLRKKITVG